MALLWPLVRPDIRTSLQYPSSETTWCGIGGTPGDDVADEDSAGYCINGEYTKFGRNS